MYCDIVFCLHYYFIVVKLPEPKKLSASEQQQLFFSFRAAMTNPHFRQTLQNISTPESLNCLMEKIPSLSEDEIALSMLHDWELLLHLADQKLIQNLVESHPALMEAVNHVMTTTHGTFGRDLPQQRRSQSGWLARSLGADLEDDGMEEDPPANPAANQQPPLDTARMAAALNFVIRNMRRRFTLFPNKFSVNIFSSKFLLTEDSSNEQAPQASSLNMQPQSNVQSSAASSTNSLTPEMFNQALRQAMRSMGNSGRRDNNANQEDTHLREQFERFLPQMRELGITDDNLSIRALQATNGDVQAAVNLIFAGLMDE